MTPPRSGPGFVRMRDAELQAKRILRGTDRCGSFTCLSFDQSVGRCYFEGSKWCVRQPAIEKYGMDFLVNRIHFVQKVLALSRNQQYVSAIPWSKGVLARHPNRSKRLTSINLRGVPSGLPGSVLMSSV